MKKYIGLLISLFLWMCSSAKMTHVENLNNFKKVIKESKVEKLELKLRNIVLNEITDADEIKTVVDYFLVDSESICNNEKKFTYNFDIYIDGKSIKVDVQPEVFFLGSYCYCYKDGFQQFIENKYDIDRL